MGAALEALDLCEVANPEATESNVEDAASSAQNAAKVREFGRKRKKAAAMLINALGDLLLRVIQGSERDPRAMLRKLIEHYASSKPTTRVAVMIEMVTKRYSTLKGDMGSYIDAFSAIVNRLTSMKVDVSEMLQVTILLASVEVQELVRGIIEIRTLTKEADVTWDNVTSRLIEEYRTLRGKKHVQYSKALAGGAKRKNPPKRIKKCTGCEKEGHIWNSCWFNHENPRNKLHHDANTDPPARARVAPANATSTIWN